jgi:serine/threonine protein kinase
VESSAELPRVRTNTRGNDVFAADVDGDGDLDVLLGNYDSPSRVLLNAGDGTFPTSTELPGGSAYTNSIAAADVDGDGDLDVLLGNQDSPSRVLLNAGDGTFPTSTELPGGSASTNSIAAADVDGDGDLDVLVGNYDSPSRVLLNAGDGTFPMTFELPGGSAHTNSIAAADVDGDGDLDVLLGNQDSPCRVLLNAGDGTFPTSAEIPRGEYGVTHTYSIVAADVDGDGDLDVLLGSWDIPNRVLLNAGDGTFPTSRKLPGGSASTNSIVAADVDGDGDLDVLVGNLGSPSVVLLNVGDGTFPTSIELPGGSSYSWSIAAADVDGDGDLDVLLGSGENQSRVLLQVGHGSFPTSIELPSWGTYGIAAADVDGDGDLDVLLGSWDNPSVVLLNAGDGTFPTSTQLHGGSSYTSSIAAADVDGDGDLDVLLGNYDSPSRVLLNAGDGTFPTIMQLPGGSAYGTDKTWSIAAADVNGDGYLDVLLGNHNSPSRVLLNAGDGTFPTSTELPGGLHELDYTSSLHADYTNSIAAADVDGDGDLDVLLGNYDTPSRVLLNAGDGTFPTNTTLPGDKLWTWSIAAADVNGDGYLDVLLGNHNRPCRVLLNAGDGTFPTSTELPGGSAYTYSIAAADVDGDGDLDVLVGNYNGPSRVLLNAGDGTFPTIMQLPSASADTFSIAVADVNGDGDLDVLLGNHEGPNYLLPLIRCSQPGTARSRFGHGCVRCPAPISRRDDSADICYECDEHTELNIGGECSSCKPGSDRSVGAAECTACPRGKRQIKAGTLCVDCSPGTYAPFDGLFAPTCLPCERGSFCPPGAAVSISCDVALVQRSNSSATNLARDEQCPHAPPHAPPNAPPPPHVPPPPPAALSAAARDVVVQPPQVAALVSTVLLIIVLLVAIACRRWWRKPIQIQTPANDKSVSMQVFRSSRPWSRLSPRLSSGLGGSSPVTVHSDEPMHLEVVDFSTLTMGDRIGEGGFATVWVAQWQGNDLAVKVLNIAVENGGSSPAQEDAMIQEVAILRRLRHPCICALFGHMRVEQRPALVLEYMAGGSLAAYLFNPRRATCNVDPPGVVQASASSLSSGVRIFRSLFRPNARNARNAHNAASAQVALQASFGRQLMEPPPTHLAGMLPCDKQRMRFGVQLASGLCFLHSHGILHHDVKTDNALLDANRTVCKLADFGLASLSLNYAGRKDRNVATAGGTLRYMAPEKLKASERHARESRNRGDGRGGRSGSGSSSLSLGRTLVCSEDRADVYAFSFLLWELTHERRAFEEMTGVAAAFSASQGLRPQFVEPHLYGMIPALTAECWAQRPEDRPSMSTVLERLEACMQALSATQGGGDSSLLSSPPNLPPSSSSSSDESLTSAEVSPYFSIKVGGTADEAYFSSKVGGTADEAYFSSKVGGTADEAYFSSKVGGTADEAYFSSKVGDTALDFQPWEAPAVAAPALSASTSTGVQAHVV